MLFNAEQLAAANKAPLDFALAYYGACLNAAERVVALNVEMTRSVMQDSMTGARAMADARDAGKAAQIQAAVVKALADKLAAYGQSVGEIAAHTQQEMAQVVKILADNQQRSMAQFLEMLVKAAPTNPGSTAAAIREFIAASNAGIRKSSHAGRNLAKAA